MERQCVCGNLCSYRGVDAVGHYLNSMKGSAPGTSIRERLDRLSMPEPNTGCFIFIGVMGNHGYGKMKVGGKTGKWHLAHRLSYEAHVRQIPQGLVIDHLCRNKSCINPLHLEPVTIGENALRGDTIPARNLLKTHCPKGHLYTDFAYSQSNGHRKCRVCGRDRDVRRRSRKNELRRTEKYREKQRVYAQEYRRQRQGGALQGTCAKVELL